MRKHKKRPITSLIIILIGWAGIASVVWYIPPNIVSEGILLLVTSLVLFLTLSWIIGKARQGLLFTLTTVLVLILRRLNILDFISFGIIVGLSGLISLII
jgi:hypothetical protein